MASEQPGWYLNLKQRFPQYMGAVEQMGEAVRAAGPLDERQAQLIQLAAAATLRSQGAVHSHARRALDAGASREEIEHALVLLTSTIGYPNVAAALSWVKDLMGE